MHPEWLRAAPGHIPCTSYRQTPNKRLSVQDLNPLVMSLARTPMAKTPQSFMRRTTSGAQEKSKHRRVSTAKYQHHWGLREHSGQGTWIQSLGLHRVPGV